jgi:hypothetical protein
VYEVLFIMSGKVGIGYRLFNQTFYGKSVSYGCKVGDYDCSQNKVSEFLYTPITITKGFCVKKEHMNEILKMGNMGL